MAQEGPGLGFLSRDYADLFRELKGPLVNKDPIELKPPFRVPHTPRAEARADASSPMGVLRVKLRMPGQRSAIDSVAKSEYMRWAVAESLSEALSRISKVKVRAADILMTTGEAEVQSVQMPYLGEHLWQFCDVRFDYTVRVSSYENAEKMVGRAFQGMVDVEADFCKTLEYRFREIYLMTIMGLSNKRHLLMDGRRISDELALFEAAQSNNLMTIERLIQAGVDVNASQKPAGFPAGLLDEDQHFLYVTLGRTPLLGAAEEGRVEAMRLLLEAKADIGFQDTSGFHALYLAAGVPDSAEKAVNVLLAFGADVHLTNSSGYTALHNACGSGEAGAIGALLEARADPSLKSKCGAAPVHTAVINGQPASLETLKKCRANLDMPAFGGNTPMHEAVMQNNPDMIQKLVDLGADVNIESGPENKFATPLKMAIERKKKKAAKKLKELGALEQIEHEYEEPLVAGRGRADLAPRVLGRVY